MAYTAKDKDDVLAWEYIIDR